MITAWYFFERMYQDDLVSALIIVGAAAGAFIYCPFND